MRTAVVGLVFGWVLVTAAAALSSPPERAVSFRPGDQRVERGGSADSLIAFSATNAEGRQQVILIDPATRAMGVYHIHSATGEIALRSVRRYHWDLQMDEFNGASPSPREIRALIESR